MVDEFLKRLEEIRSRAAEIAKLDVIDEEARTELRTLRDERTELEAKIADEELVAELTADAPKPKAEEKVEEAPAEEAPEVEAPAEEVVEEEKAEPTAEAIAAAVSAAAPKDEGMQATEEQGLAIVASSASYGMQVGTKMEVADWQKVFRSAGQQGEGRHVFASIDRGVSGREALSSRNSAIQNTVIMSQRAEEEAAKRLSAAACYCGPFETDKNILSLGMDDRPVAGLFRSVPVTGPFKYVRDINLADVAAGVTLWECADQTSITNDPSTWKPCVDLACLPEYEVTPYAIPACGRFSIFQQVSHPELIDDFIKKLGIVYARLAEQALLDTLVADSTVLTYGLGGGMGILNQLEGVLGHLAGFSGYVRRIDWSDYALILPPGFMDALVADEHRRGFSRGANRASIMQQIRELGVGQVIEALDADTAAETQYLAAHGLYVDPGNTVAFDTCTAIGTWTINIVPVSAYTRGESTLVEAGFQRDADLTRRNEVQWFMEGHEFLEKMTPDVPSFTLELTGAGTGGTSAMVTPEICVP